MRFFIYLSYDGAQYHGWQIQPNGVSVQEVMQKALSTLLRETTDIVGAGRTDAGVNAKVMVAHFDCSDAAASVIMQHCGEETVPLSAACPEVRLAEATRTFVKKMNRILPPDISVQKILPVKADAHARFDAVARTYHYYVTTEKSPFSRYYSYRFPQVLDFALMNEAARRLFNYTDFTSFSKLHTDVKTNNCRIMAAEWTQTADTEWVFTIKADRFLRNMVRAVVGTLFEVGRGRMSVEEFCRVIERKDRCAAGSSVPGNALFLAEVEYPADIFELNI
ncbi:MAG: tRNA pseudouridine(38-40) synthase TruA [Bacteroides sp.]|nr:tRNA pseudouridine(38-40) synthase TruA [Roseburia sp.]MCM1346862.1 tRNA pseudouridine(38-40) synthase TruA [Bacteroides sp.]MCM1420046.1 tRNA pseudouridine(38-40) synthase TruA [Bacteroides sp.]